MKKEILLFEVDDILRTMPPRATLRHDSDENFAWLGRVAAFIESWNSVKSIPLNMALRDFHGLDAHIAQQGFRNIMTLLHQARHDLNLNTKGPLNSALNQGQVFDYFEEIRKIIELANQDVFFIDPFLNAEFVSRYLPYIKSGITIRLLARELVVTLTPSVQQYIKQTGATVSVRSSKGFHDRYVIVDGFSCYQSGASFKDGAKSAPTTLTQITDAFEVVRKAYEDIWSDSEIII